MAIFEKKLKYYYKGNLHVVPYRHFYHNNIWKVMVNEYKEFSEEDNTAVTHHINVLADSAHEACKKAIKEVEKKRAIAFQRHKELQQALQKINIENPESLPETHKLKSLIDQPRIKYKKMRTISA